MSTAPRATVFRLARTSAGKLLIVAVAEEKLQATLDAAQAHLEEIEERDETSA